MKKYIHMYTYVHIDTYIYLQIYIYIYVYLLNTQLLHLWAPPLPPTSSFAYAFVSYTGIGLIWYAALDSQCKLGAECISQLLHIFNPVNEMSIPFKMVL